MRKKLFKVDYKNDIRKTKRLWTGVLPLETYYIPRKLVSLFSVAPCRRIPIAASSFDAQFPLQSEAPELRRCEPVLGFNFARVPKPNRHSRDFFHAV
ncbi:hypothetical protein TNCV_1860811 [Trichonephila clavipes]|nr:hypothetical protein TNCV_1860811 [Trichonephila clavipes]